MLPAPKFQDPGLCVAFVGFFGPLDEILGTLEAVLGRSWKLLGHSWRLFGLRLLERIWEPHGVNRIWNTGGQGWMH